MAEEESYKHLYVVESRENHEILVRNLLALEGEDKNGAIDEIFRAAHTLKGMSASMGYSTMEHLCHSMEDVFHLLRDHTLEVEQNLIDILLACTDKIEEILDEIEQGGDGSSREIGDLITALQAWKGDTPLQVSESRIPTSSGQSPAFEDTAVSPAGSRYRISIRVNKNCEMKEIRAMLALQNLEELGKILSTTPCRDDIENGRFDDIFSLELESRNESESLRRAAAGIDIAEIQITGEPLQESAGSQGESGRNGTKVEKNKEVKNIRVDIARLDRMMNLVEDLVINRGRLKQIATKNQIKDLDDAINLMGRSISDLQNLMMNVRMIPLAHIFNRFPRVVRDVAHHDGKEVEFIMEGGETELDRSIMDGLSDPLLHLIRNAVNHGIESPEVRRSKGKNPRGLVKLTACRDKDNVIIEIQDDGNGIDGKKIQAKAVEMGIISMEDAAALSPEEITRLLFRPGFSTAEQVTDISGRGVGLDVVKRAIELLKGSIRIESEIGKGTRFQLILPPTMAIAEVMMVRINGRRCAIPITNVVEVAVLRPDSICHIGGKEVLLLRDEVLSLRRLEDMFGTKNGKDLVIVVQHQHKKAGITIDAVEGQQEVVIKPLNILFGSCRGIGGVTIPGDGEVVSVLDVSTLL